MRRKSLPLCLALAAWLLAGAALPAKSDPDSRGALSPGLELVPPDAAGFITFRAAELYQSPATRELREQLAKAEPGFLKSFHEHVGVPLAQIERVTVILLGGKHDPPTVVVTTVKPFDRETVRKALLPRGETKQLAGKTVHAEPGQHGQVLYFPSDRVFVIGFNQNIEPVLKFKPRPNEKGPLSGALTLAAGQHQVVASFNLAAPVFRENAKDFKAEFKALVPLLNAQKGELTIVSDAATLGTLRLTYAEESGAKEAREAVEKARTLFLDLVAKGKKEVTHELESPRQNPLGKYFLRKVMGIMDQAKDGLKEASVKTAGPRTVAVAMKSKTSAADLIFLFVELFGIGSGKAEARPAQADLPPQRAKP